MLQRFITLLVPAALVAAQYANGTASSDLAKSEDSLLVDGNLSGSKTLPTQFGSSVMHLDPTDMPHVNGSVVYSTKYEVVSEFTTYCPEATMLTVNNKTIVVTEPTVLTITDCPCTLTHVESSIHEVAPASQMPPPSAVTTTRTEVVSEFTTYCPEATTLTYNNKTIVITEATEVTVTDCPCTLTHVEEQKPESKAPAEAAPTSVSEKETHTTVKAKATSTESTKSHSNSTSNETIYTGSAAKKSYSGILVMACIMLSFF